MAAPDPIIPPDPIEANIDYRYDGCYQSMVLVLLQRLIDSSGGGDTAKLQEILDELIALNGKVATEATLAQIQAITAQMNFTGGALDVNATVSTDGLATEPTLQGVELNTNRSENLLSELIQEQKKTNKILRKIGNDE